MIDVVQELADDLAEVLQRSVAVDDPGLRLLVATAHFEDVDEARMNSLVGRRLVGPTRDYVMKSGAQRWHEPTRMEANPDVGFERPRWCFPLRSRYELLGFMWLMDDGGITGEQLTLAAETAQRIEGVLARRAESSVEADIEVESLLLRLLTGDRADREHAAAELRDLGLFRDTGHLGVLVVHNAGTERSSQPDRYADAVRRGISTVMQTRLRESFTYSVSGREAVLVVGFHKEPGDAELLARAADLHDEILRFDPGDSSAVTVGTGSPVTGLAGVRDAFQQGLVAAHVARDKARPVAAWNGHPLESLLRVCVTPELPASLLPSALRTLDGQPVGTQQVVATFLATAGNVNETANRMHLHRTTVYYRLAKFRERTGLDLDDGPTRLLLHLWFAARDLVTLTDRERDRGPGRERDRDRDRERDRD